MKKLFLVTLIINASLAVNVTIHWDEWPYGAECIGNWFKWWYNGNTPVFCPAFNPSDTIWDFASGSTAATSESYIMDKSQAQGNPPAIATYAEKQVLAGDVSWGYESKDTSGTIQNMWFYGFFASGQQIDYDPPYYKVYQFPMQLGSAWSSEWTWNFMGVDIVHESRIISVIAQGWVRVPMDTTQWFPCLVMRIYMSTWDEFGMIDEEYIVHEWVSPIYGSLVTIQSQNHETNPGFTTAKYFFRMKEQYLANDVFPPNFSQTTIIPSGYNFGPFHISSIITDQSGIHTDSIYYKIGSGSWQRLYSDSIIGDNFYFHIPQISNPDTVHYYLIAKDNSPNLNRGTDPQNAPAVHYKFYANDPANDHNPPAITNTAIWTDTTFLGPYLVSANIFDSCGVDSAFLFYRFNVGSWQIALPDSIRNSDYYFRIPEATPNTFIRYYLRAVDLSPNHNVALDPPSGYYAFNVEDGIPPEFTNTTVWTDTNFAGPFPVQSLITDFSGIHSALIFFKLGTALWDSLSYDSVQGDTFYFHIPSISGSMAIRYYLKAFDGSSRLNMATDPPNAPNVTYIFYATVGINELLKTEQFPNRIYLKSINPEELSFYSNDDYSLEVYNSVGQKVELIAKGKGKGNNSIRFNSQKLGSGNYFLILKTKNHWLIEPFLVVK